MSSTSALACLPSTPSTRGLSYAQIVKYADRQRENHEARVFVRFWRSKTFTAEGMFYPANGDSDTMHACGNYYSVELRFMQVDGQYRVSFEVTVAECTTPKKYTYVLNESEMGLLRQQVLAKWEKTSFVMLQVDVGIVRNICSFVLRFATRFDTVEIELSK